MSMPSQRTSGPPLKLARVALNVLKGGRPPDVLTAAVSLASQPQPCIQSWSFRPSRSVECCSGQTAVACGCPGRGTCSTTRLRHGQSQLTIAWPLLGPAPGGGCLGCRSSRLRQGISCVGCMRGFLPQGFLEGDQWCLEAASALHPAPRYHETLSFFRMHSASSLVVVQDRVVHVSLDEIGRGCSLAENWAWIFPRRCS